MFQFNFSANLRHVYGDVNIREREKAINMYLNNKENIEKHGEG